MRTSNTDQTTAVRTLPEPPFLLVDGAGWGDDAGRLFASPRAVLTEREGTFVELPSGAAVDPVQWLRERSDRLLAGFLGYEFAWSLLDIRSDRPRSPHPMLWVGEFEGAAEPAGATRRVMPAIAPARCSIDEADYRVRVEHCVRDIWNGELFEVNFTARFRTEWADTPATFYEAMRASSSGEFFGLLHTGDFAIASVSPEEFITVDGRTVSTRPIKGTRRREVEPSEDRRVADELLASEKDRAENIMIVDLMRNDLTRVCELGTVQASRVCELETFAGVHHLVSTVEGRLGPDRAPIDALLDCFPAGSITGAPKLRAIELAAEYEADARGPYTGSMFVARPGELRSNVLIRTATLTRRSNAWSVEYGAGGAVVADSVAQSEWEETLTKTAPLRRMEAS